MWIWRGNTPGFRGPFCSVIVENAELFEQKWCQLIHNQRMPFVLRADQCRAWLDEDWFSVLENPDRAPQLNAGHGQLLSM